MHPEDAGGRVIDPALAGTFDPWSPSLDHIIRECDGGTDRDENLRAAHRWCNQRHGTLAANGRQSNLRTGWRGVPAPREPAPLGGTDVASRIGADAADRLAALSARLEADAAAFREEVAALDEAGFAARTLDRLGLEPAAADERETMNRRRGAVMKRREWAVLAVAAALGLIVSGVLLGLGAAPRATAAPACSVAAVVLVVAAYKARRR
jgi:hypothetical protein